MAEPDAAVIRRLEIGRRDRGEDRDESAGQGAGFSKGNLTSVPGSIALNNDALPTQMVLNQNRYVPSSGQIVPGYEARVVDEHNQPVAAGEIGNLLIRGDSTCSGYWNKHEKTKEASLDPDQPAIRRALENAQSNPEAIYVLLAAIYGAVNRALEKVTDHDEARMLGALIRHLGANPELLEGATASGR